MTVASKKGLLCYLSTVFLIPIIVCMFTHTQSMTSKEQTWSLHTIPRGCRPSKKHHLTCFTSFETNWQTWSQQIYQIKDQWGWIRHLLGNASSVFLSKRLLFLLFSCANVWFHLRSETDNNSLSSNGIIYTVKTFWNWSTNRKKCFHGRTMRYTPAWPCHRWWVSNRENVLCLPPPLSQFPLFLGLKDYTDFNIY